jgi:peptide-methionine (S)-S-oxide reductase
MKTEKAVFGMGCFWGPQAMFDKVEGVVSTRVGYTGGSKENPTYYDLGDHLEAVEITFDPAKVSYSKLLDMFWEMHDPTYENPTQYQSAIFYDGKAQETAARKSLDDARERSPRTILTRLEPLGAFYEAEDYHQKYYQKCRLA